MKTLIAFAALLSLVCFTPPLRAQDAAVDPKRAAAAEELLKTMHVDEMMEKQKDTVKKMLASFLPKDLSPEELKQVQAVQDASLDVAFKQLTWESLKTDFIRIYSEVYTEDELKQLADFYKSPIGQKFIDKMPELQAKTMEIVQKRMITILPAVQAAAKDAMEKIKSGEGAGQTPDSGPSNPPMSAPEGSAGKP
jgi:hypothetical protein